MATEHITKIKCDRCGQTIDEAEGPAVERELGEVEELILTFGDHPVVRFADLCDRCKARCAKLMDDVRNGKKGKRKDTTDKEPTS